MAGPCSTTPRPIQTASRPPSTSRHSSPTARSPWSTQSAAGADPTSTGASPPPGRSVVPARRRATHRHVSGRSRQRARHADRRRGGRHAPGARCPRPAVRVARRPWRRYPRRVRAHPAGDLIVLVGAQGMNDGKTLLAAALGLVQAKSLLASVARPRACHRRERRVQRRTNRKLRLSSAGTSVRTTPRRTD